MKPKRILYNYSDPGRQEDIVPAGNHLVMSDEYCAYWTEHHPYGHGWWRCWLHRAYHFEWPMFVLIKSWMPADGWNGDGREERMLVPKVGIELAQKHGQKVSDEWPKFDSSWWYQEEKKDEISEYLHKIYWWFEKFLEEAEKEKIDEKIRNYQNELDRKFRDRNGL